MSQRENLPFEATQSDPKKCPNLVRTTFEIKHAIKERHKFILVVGPTGKLFIILSILILSLVSKT